MNFPESGTLANVNSSSPLSVNAVLYGQPVAFVEDDSAGRMGIYAPAGTVVDLGVVFARSLGVQGV
jgi:hypothetical protein